MSSPSEGADPAPASSAESTAPSTVTSSSSSSESSTEGQRKAAPIRIGSQRYGVKPPPAVAKPILAAPVKPQAVVESPKAPAAEEPAGAASTPEPISAEAVTAAAPAEAPTAQSESPAEDATAPAAAPPTLAPRGPRPDRPRGAKSVVAPPPVMPKVEPPNIRAGLSAELELEYLEALGGQSLDQIIASEQGAVVAELEPDSRHRGKVIAVHRDNVFFEIAGHQQGVAPLKNFATPPEPGAVLDIVVSRFNAADGLYELNLPGASVDVGDWSEVAEGMVVDAVVTGHNKGGLECEVSRLRGFIPASQVSMYRVEDLAQFVGQKFACVITEANPEKRNLVLSRRAVLEREKAEAKESMMASLEVGQTREGTVRSLQAFGAFVDLGGVDGLIHISQLSWDRIKHADEVLQLGQKVKVKIQKIDPATGKIGLAFRDLAENPWENVARDFPARTTVKGTVTRLMDFGAFVRLAPGVEGLVHISELSHKRVFRVSDVLTEGQEVEVQVQNVDAEQQRISLSLKALEARAEKARPVEEEAEPEAPAAPPKKRKVPLKGGIGGPASGEKFGLKW